MAPPPGTAQSAARSGTENDDPGNSPRFQHWILFLVFSVITLGSSIEARDDSIEDPDIISKQKWAVACAAITFSITTIVVCMHLSPMLSIFIVGTKFECVVITLMIAFWSATVAIVSDPQNGLAVNPDGEVSFGNLYYASWAGFVLSVVLLTSYLRSTCRIDVQSAMADRSPRLGSWTALMTSSLVVMGSAATIYDSDCGPNKLQYSPSQKYCNRTVLAVALGCAGALASLVMVGLKIASGKAPFALEAVTGFVLFVSYAFGVAYITSVDGPGGPLGNLYYFSWITFGLAFLIGAGCFEEYVAVKETLEGMAPVPTAATIAGEDEDQYNYDIDNSSAGRDGGESSRYEIGGLDDDNDDADGQVQRHGQGFASDRALGGTSSIGDSRIN